MVQAETTPETLAGVFEELLKSKQGSALLHEVPDYAPGLRQGSAHILELRALVRHKCEEAERLRKTTATARVTLDSSSLKLKNLEYEKDHYSKETQACLSFQSAYPDETLELLPRADFLRVWGEDPGLDEHAEMVNRLTHEVAFRKETMQQLDALCAKRDALAADVAQRRSDVTALEAEVARLGAGARKLAARFSVKLPVPDLAMESSGASSLPRPLYIAYSQLRAAAATLGAVPPAASSAGGPRVEVACSAAGEGAMSQVTLRVRGEAEEVVFGASLTFDGDAGVVTVEPHGPSTTLEDLAALRPGDAGIAQSGPPAFAWAQRLAALDILPALAPDGGGPEALECYRRENRPGVLLAAILEQCEARRSQTAPEAMEEETVAAVGDAVE